MKKITKKLLSLHIKYQLLQESVSWFMNPYPSMVLTGSNFDLTKMIPRNIYLNLLIKLCPCCFTQMLDPKLKAWHLHLLSSFESVVVSCLFFLNSELVVLKMFLTLALGFHYLPIPSPCLSNTQLKSFCIYIHPDLYIVLQ